MTPLNRKILHKLLNTPVLLMCKLSPNEASFSPLQQVFNVFLNMQASLSMNYIRRIIQDVFGSHRFRGHCDSNLKANIHNTRWNYEWISHTNINLNFSKQFFEIIPLSLLLKTHLFERLIFQYCITINFSWLFLRVNSFHHYKNTSSCSRN